MHLMQDSAFRLSVCCNIGAGCASEARLMALPAMSLLALPYVRRELPGWGTVARYAGIFDEHRWRGADPRTIRGKLHGYQLHLDLADWSDRQTFFLGRFYELETQLTLRALLRGGDTLVDV